MDTLAFTLVALAAFGAPIVALNYMRPILLTVLRQICDAEGGAEFWLRSAYLLATSGSLLLTLVFALGADGIEELVRRSLISTLIGVFVTVGFIAYTVWGQVTRPALDQAKLAFEAGYARAAATAPLKG